MSDRWPSEFCETHRKTGYPSGVVAHEVLQAIAAAPQTPVYPKRFYRGEECGLFHLTSSPPEKLRRTAAPIDKRPKTPPANKKRQFPQPEVTDESYPVARDSRWDYTH